MGSLADQFLLPHPLTETGRPILQSEEIEVYLSDDVSFEFEFKPGVVIEKETLRHGLCSLTTHRLIWMDEFCSAGQKKRSFALPFQNVASVSRETSYWKSSRIRINVQSWRNENSSVPKISNQPTISIVLVFRSKTASFDNFFAKISQQLEKKAWLKDSTKSTALSAQPFRQNPSAAGISGIMRREQQQLEQTDRNLSEAFSDLNALMNKAQDMVKLAETIKSKLNSQARSHEETETVSSQDMQDWLLSVGIASPVTKDSAGASYHRELAKQLVDFLDSGPVHKAGGMLSLVDAYCIVNKARGTELISPEDLLQACQIWDTMQVPIKLRRFESGVAVIQHHSLNEEKIFGTIASLVSMKNGQLVGINANDLSKSLGIAASLAKEQLLLAETKGHLCRDDSSDGLIFYHNFFRDVTLGI